MKDLTKKILNSYHPKKSWQMEATVKMLFQAIHLAGLSGDKSKLRILKRQVGDLRLNLAKIERDIVHLIDNVGE